MKPDINYHQYHNKFTMEDAEELLSLFSGTEDIDLEQFCMGLNIELEHGIINNKFNITNDDGRRTALIVLSHITEIPDYYTRLQKMKQEALKEKTNKIESYTIGSDIIGTISPEEHDAGDFLIKNI